MGRPILPPEVTPEQLEALFREIIHLDPLKEKAVRLRLTGLVYREIAALLNSEIQYGTKINQMWVQRGCRRAIKQLIRFLSLEETMDKKSNYYVKNALYQPVERILAALVWAGHERPHKRNNDPQDVKPVAVRPKRIVYCGNCNGTEWTYYFENQGGHRNIRIYRCLKCNSEFLADQN